MSAQQIIRQVNAQYIIYKYIRKKTPDITNTFWLYSSNIAPKYCTLNRTVAVCLLQLGQQSLCHVQAHSYSTRQLQACVQDFSCSTLYAHNVTWRVEMHIQIPMLWRELKTPYMFWLVHIQLVCQNFYVKRTSQSGHIIISAFNSRFYLFSTIFYYIHTFHRNMVNHPFLVHILHL
jgi:hypothetical protein